MNGKVYAIGGIGSDFKTYLNIVQMYDPSTNTWTPAAPLSLARGNLAATDANGFIFAIGGSIKLNPALSIVEQYSPAIALYLFTKN